MIIVDENLGLSQRREHSFELIEDARIARCCGTRVSLAQRYRKANTARFSINEDSDLHCACVSAWQPRCSKFAIIMGKIWHGLIISPQSVYSSNIVQSDERTYGFIPGRQLLSFLVITGFLTIATLAVAIIWNKRPCRALNPPKSPATP
jgi:hypothetical protein